MAAGWRIVPSSLCPLKRWSESVLESFKEYPIRQKPASFSLDGVMEKLSAPQAASRRRRRCAPRSKLKAKSGSVSA